MFSKKQRLKREEIGIILKNPDFFFTSPNFSLKAKKNNYPFPRFAVVIPKKNERSAVKRHFLKRRVVALLKRTENIPSIDGIIFIKDSLKDKKDENIKNELENLLNKCIIVE